MTGFEWLITYLVVGVTVGFLAAAFMRVGGGPNCEEERDG